MNAHHSECMHKWNELLMTSVDLRLMTGHDGTLLIVLFPNQSSTQCTKPCATGHQRRTVKCVRPIGVAMKESDGCKLVRRLPIFQSCNVHACESETNNDVEPPQQPATVDLIQNDAEIGMHSMCKCQICLTHRAD